MRDYQVLDLINAETVRQRETLCMLASENIQSSDCLEAQASTFANKTLEGMPKKRYHAGGIHADEIELLAAERACGLFKAGYANVQPHSGSQANHIVYRALLQPGDRILAMDLDAGGHLSHGAKVNITSDTYRFDHYGLSRETDLIDYAALEEKAKLVRPRMIVCGGSSYPRFIDFSRIASTCREVGALLMVDMAHFAGQVAASLYANPVDVADVVTSTLYKSLRGPRGGMILAKDAEIGRRINRAVFPGYQGTPAFNTIAAKAICLREAAQADFREYVRSSLVLAQRLTQRLNSAGFDTIGGKTDTSMVLVDLRLRNVSGKQVADLLEAVGVIANHNLAPFDHRPASQGSAVRLCTNVMAVRKLEPVAEKIFDLIIEIFESVDGGAECDVQQLRRRMKSLLLETQFAEYGIAS